MGLRVQYFGQPYPDTPRYYWVDVRFPCCDGPLLGPAAVMTAEHLDNNNTVLCQWDVVPGATEYLLLCTDDPTVPAAGAQCMLTRGWNTSFNDVGQGLSELPDFSKAEKRAAPGKTFEVELQKPSPRPDRRQNHPDALKDKEEQKKAEKAEKADKSEHASKIPPPVAPHGTVGTTGHQETTKK